MIKIENLSYSFPQKDLYKDISFTIEDGQHCAFIGTNGTGKSTLLDIIMDPDAYAYDGEIEMEPHSLIGFVSQFSRVDKSSDITVFDYIGEEFIKLQNEITTICTEMETATDIDVLLEKYQEALDAFQAIDGDDYESLINKKLNLANLDRHRDLKISELSGGEFKLIQVIKEMLRKPDLMIMDEPDVFLDFENLNSLMELINAYKGTLLIITHNRYLLNHCFNKIIHLENMELQEFDGSYVEYNFTLLETKIELQELAIADEEEIARNAVLIDRLRYIATHNSEASRGRALKARVKIQERLEARRIKAPFVDIKQPNIKLPSVNVPEEPTDEENIVIKVEDYSAAYDELLLSDVSFEIKSGEKVALIGANGTGKTTLFRDIYNNTSPAISIGEDINLAYLSQHQGETLDENNTILEEFFDIGFETYEDIVFYVSQYGIGEEYINHRIDTLSGGEKNLLQLAKISCSNANMLLLDEPTSHLDTYSQLALEKAINNYKGTVVMVSHDYYTISNTMDYILIIEDKTIRRMNLKKFRRKIYANHFDRDYLALEQEKKSLETRIEMALMNRDFEQAQIICEDLEELIKKL